MKLDPGIHIDMHSVFFLKPGVTTATSTRVGTPTRRRADAPSGTTSGRRRTSASTRASRRSSPRVRIIPPPARARRLRLHPAPVTPTHTTAARRSGAARRRPRRASLAFASMLGRRPVSAPWLLTPMLTGLLPLWQSLYFSQSQALRYVPSTPLTEELEDLYTALDN